MGEKECLTYEINDKGNEFEMTLPFCSDWQQDVTFTYYKKTGKILEGSSGDLTEYCEYVSSHRTEF